MHICVFLQDWRILKIDSEIALFGDLGQRGRPDLIIHTGSTSFIVEIGVTAETLDSTCLSTKFLDKRTKYDLSWVKKAARQTGKIPERNKIMVVPIIIGARGSFSAKIPAEVHALARALKVSGRKLLSCAAQTAAEGSLLTIDKLIGHPGNDWTLCSLTTEREGWD